MLSKSNLLLAFLLPVLLMSCSPTIHYLGESYGISSDVDVYYSIDDIERDHKIIGHMTHDRILNYNPELLKEEMIKTAHEKGADAVVFKKYGPECDGDSDEKFVVEASLVKYK